MEPILVAIGTYSADGNRTTMASGTFSFDEFGYTVNGYWIKNGYFRLEYHQIVCVKNQRYGMPPFGKYLGVRGLLIEYSDDRNIKCFTGISVFRKNNNRMLEIFQQHGIPVPAPRKSLLTVLRSFKHTYR